MPFDAATDGGAITSTGLTFAHTCAGSNRLLRVGVLRVEQPVTGVTYAGVAMAQIAVNDDPVAGNFTYVFELPNPASGANNVIITTGVSSYITGLAASYTDAAQSGQPDRVVTNRDTSSTSTLSTRLTPRADNCWITMLKESDQLVVSAVGCVERVVNTDGRTSWLDSNGPISPPNMTTLSFLTTFVGPQHTAILASFAPLDGGPFAILNRGMTRRQRAGFTVSSPGGFF